LRNERRSAFCGSSTAAVADRFTSDITSLLREVARDSGASGLAARALLLSAYMFSTLSRREVDCGAGFIFLNGPRPELIGRRVPAAFLYFP
jgi:hypothetical protein